MQNPFRRTPQGAEAQTTIGGTLVATFTGRATPAMAMEAFGWLMLQLRLWEPLEKPEHVALHNVALQIVNTMRANPSLNLKDLSTLKFEIEHAHAEDREV